MTTFVVRVLILVIVCVCSSMAPRHADSWMIYLIHGFAAVCVATWFWFERRQAKKIADAHDQQVRGATRKAKEESEGCATELLNAFQKGDWVVVLAALPDEDIYVLEGAGKKQRIVRLVGVKHVKAGRHYIVVDRNLRDMHAAKPTAEELAKTTA